MILILIAPDLWVDPDAVVAVRDNGNGAADVYLATHEQPVGCLASVPQVLKALRADGEGERAVPLTVLADSRIDVPR